MDGTNRWDAVLPHGLRDEAGTCHRHARLRPLTGWQEADRTAFRW